ncbi:MAG: hypothetical protein Q8S58_03335, partial [Bosea sp. (in: a-proteobacteria)]|nr:hypothetical protein [Bosea sp. (in: a-proteobacteria)]
MAVGVGALALVSRGLINASRNGKPPMCPPAAAELGLRALTVMALRPAAPSGGRLSPRRRDRIGCARLPGRAVSTTCRHPNHCVRFR